MIRYQLACDAGHRFESWFRNSDAYDEQAARALVSCPECRSTSVGKAIMAPALLGPRQDLGASQDLSTRQDKHLAIPPPAAGSSMDVALLDPKARELRALVKALRDKVVSNGQDVGVRFPEEARRMHDGEIPHRQIYGQATAAEARELIEDGITILPLPGLPDDLN